MGNGGVYLEDQEDQLSLHHDQEELTYNQVSLIESVAMLNFILILPDTSK